MYHRHFTQSLTHSGTALRRLDPAEVLIHLTMVYTAAPVFFRCRLITNKPPALPGWYMIFNGLLVHYGRKYVLIAHYSPAN